MLTIRGGAPSDWTCRLVPVWTNASIGNMDSQLMDGVCACCLGPARDLMDQVYRLWQRANSELCSKQIEAYRKGVDAVSSAAAAATTACKRKAEVVEVSDDDDDASDSVQSTATKKPKH